MKKTVLRSYAKLIAACGVNIQKGQEVFIQAELDQPEFVTMLVEECYKLKAKKVVVDWSHQPIDKLHVRYRSLTTMSKLDNYEQARWQHYVDTIPCRIYLISEDPDGLKGVNQEKMAKAQQKKYPIIKGYRDQIENKYQWCIAAVPGEKWAKKLFPNLRASQAVEKLWEAILATGGNVDLSVGSVVAFAGAMMGALTLNSGMPTWQAVAITLVTGVLIGAMQGSFIAFLNVPPFIATLSGELVFRGLTQVVLQGQTLSPFSDGFKFFASGFVLRDVEVFGVNAVCLVCLILGTAAIIFSELKKRRSNKKYGFAQTSIFVSVAKCVFLIAVLAAILLSLSTHNGMPFILLVMAVLAIVYTFIANKTVLGRHVSMVGGNPKAAKLSGVRTDLVMLAVYTNMAFLSTIAGFVVAGRLNAASPKAGTGYELDAIAACTIGGAGSASGTIMGSIIGATVMAILNNGMSILGIGTDMQQVIKGCILLLAVTFDIYSKTKSKK